MSGFRAAVLDALPSPDQKVVQEAAQEAAQEEADKAKKKLQKKSRDDMEIADDNSAVGESSLVNSEYENKEDARLARKKVNAHKVIQYKKMNFSRTNKHGHRAV